MPSIEVNGKTVQYRVAPYQTSQSLAFYRRRIIEAFAKIGIMDPYLDIRGGGGNGSWSQDGWAEVLWQVNGVDHQYRCDSQGREVANLAAISQIIEADVKAIRRGLKTFGQVMNQFRIGYDEKGEKVRSPRQVLGVEEGNKDLDYISYKFKQKAKETHPDSGGDAEAFKKVNEAYNALKEELK